MGNRATWIRLAAAAASGVMVALLFPPFNVSMLVWVALIPLLTVLWSLDARHRARRGFLFSGFAGLVSCGIQFYWFGIVAPVAAILIPTYLALYWAAFGTFAATLCRPRPDDEERDTLERIAHSLRIAFCLAAVWAGLEWFRSWFLTGFGWNPLGVAFHQSPVLAQAADLLGVVGLSMVPVFFQSVLLQTACRLIFSARSGQRQTRLDFGIAALVVALLVCYGLIRISSEGAKDSLRLKTMLIQINIPQDNARRLWEPLEIHLAYEEETLAALNGVIDADNQRLLKALEASDEATIDTQWPDWVMWPEAALSGSLMTAADGTWGTWQENMESINRVREAGPFQLIYGVTEWEAVRNPEDDMMLLMEGGRAWNSLAVMDPENELQTYQKHHLVLFGETIPLVDQIPLLKTIYEKQSGAEFGGSFTPGTSYDSLPIPLADGNVIHAIPTICFEDSVPRLTRKFLRQEPQVIINVTNDGWFKESPAAAQHFANAKFRAIEFRRPMLRCANNGVSAAVDSIGSSAHPNTGGTQILVDANGSHFTRGSLLTNLDVPIQPSFTLYALIGDWGIIALSLTATMVAVLRRNGSTQQRDLSMWRRSMNSASIE